MSLTLLVRLSRPDSATLLPASYSLVSLQRGAVTCTHYGTSMSVFITYYISVHPSDRHFIFYARESCFPWPLSPSLDL